MDFIEIKTILLKLFLFTKVWNNEYAKLTNSLILSVKRGRLSHLNLRIAPYKYWCREIAKFLC